MMTVENNHNSGNVADGGSGTPSVEANPARESRDHSVTEGMATESGGRETAPDLYESDVFGRVERRSRDNIWTRGHERRISHKRSKKPEEDE